MREIGGYLELEHFTGAEYHQNALRFNTATNALLWLLKKRDYRKIYFPEFLCASVFDAVKERTDLEIAFYTVDDSLSPVLKMVLPEDEVLYVVNYYDRMEPDFIRQLQSRAASLILDNVQAFFQPPLAGVDTLYSCRKWFGVPDGVYLYTEFSQECALSSMSARPLMEHLVGRCEDGANAWYGTFRQNEEYLLHAPEARMSLLTRNLLCAVDYERVSARRQANFRVLDEAFEKINLLKSAFADVPFMYPLRLREEQAQQVRSKLLDSKIYIPVLWSNLSRRGAQLSRSILPLPVDQRYMESDMLYLAERLKEVLSWK